MKNHQKILVLMLINNKTIRLENRLKIIKEFLIC